MHALERGAVGRYSNDLTECFHNTQYSCQRLLVDDELVSCMASNAYTCIVWSCKHCSCCFWGQHLHNRMNTLESAVMLCDIKFQTHLENTFRAVWGVAGAAFILGLPLLSGVTAFAATTSIACAGLALTYGVPILLRIVTRRSYLETGPFTLGRCDAFLDSLLPLPLMFAHLLPPSILSCLTFNFC